METCSSLSRGGEWLTTTCEQSENCHSMASAWLYNQLLSELKTLGEITEEQRNRYEEAILNIARMVYEHESRIVDLIFEKGDIRTITKDEMLEFVKNRIDVVLGYLNIAPLFGVPDGKVSKWFYDALSSYKYSDFFANQQIQYVRNWAKYKLKFKGE